ncbi:hypothetical protein DUI87_06203 [Hirundo rustica rustica]|uniref:Retroviral nucleocapsid Gag protein p24 C-terminal domain-containing protein n=1 Tax=Hirundo rustica rustica TaxID=333673 RepID=A0A3M0KUQ6_HIRRU|nr:hypothetical protein DUI87_06203 [Hirundo rustica rustica]
MLSDTAHTKMLMGIRGFVLGFVFLLLGLRFYLCKKCRKFFPRTEIKASVSLSSGLGSQNPLPRSLTLQGNQRNALDSNTRGEEDSSGAPSESSSGGEPTTPGFTSSRRGSAWVSVGDDKFRKEMGVKLSVTQKSVFYSFVSIVQNAQLKISKEFKLWEVAWTQLLRDALPGLLTDPETTVDGDGNALTFEHLAGEGHWETPADQAASIPLKALQIIRDCALTAFFGTVPDSPVVPYYKIVQGTKESFTGFVERLTRAIEIQAPNASVREGILREMAFANANAMSRTVILSLPSDPPPTIQEMLRVCQLKVPFTQAGDTDQRGRIPKVAAHDGARPSETPVPKRRPYVPNRQRCYICRDAGHWASQSPLKEEIEAPKNRKGGGGEDGSLGQRPNQKK